MFRKKTAFGKKVIFAKLAEIFTLTKRTGNRNPGGGIRCLPPGIKGYQIFASTVVSNSHTFPTDGIFTASSGEWGWTRVGPYEIMSNLG